jgi:hypothetical protein
MRKIIPAAALGLGLASYCFLLLVSREATRVSLAILGIMSISIISISLSILWSVKNESAQEPIEKVPIEQNSASETESEMYLEISQ